MTSKQWDQFSCVTHKLTQIVIQKVTSIMRSMEIFFCSFLQSLYNPDLLTDFVNKPSIYWMLYISLKYLMHVRLEDLPPGRWDLGSKRDFTSKACLLPSIPDLWPSLSVSIFFRAYVLPAELLPGICRWANHGVCFTPSRPHLVCSINSVLSNSHVLSTMTSLLLSTEIKEIDDV